MFCILAVFVPSFFMIGVGRQLFVPLSLAVGFSMIASYLLSSTLVPVFSTWLMREAHRGEERRVFGCCARSTSAICAACCASAGRSRSSISAASVGLLYVLLPAHGNRDLPRRRTRRCSAFACARRPARASRRPSASCCARSTSSAARPARTTSRSPATSSASCPPAIPVNLIHLFTSGPQEADHSGRAQARRAARRGAARADPRSALRHELPGHAGLLRSRRHRQPGDELRLADADRSGGAGRQSRRRLCVSRRRSRRSWRSSTSSAICNSRRRSTIPTLDITVDRERAGQFGLTMADVVALRRAGDFVVALHRARTTGAIRTPATPSRSRCSCRRIACRAWRRSAAFPVMRDGRAQPQLSDIADAEARHHARADRALQRAARRQPHRQHPRHDAGRSGAADPARYRRRRRAAPRRDACGCAARFRRSSRRSPDCASDCCSRCSSIFLLLAANFQSLRLALAILLTIPAVLCGVLLMLRLTGTTLNVQSFMGAIMAIGIAVANSILLVTFAERARHEGRAVARRHARRRRLAGCAPS